MQLGITVHLQLSHQLNSHVQEANGLQQLPTLKHQIAQHAQLENTVLLVLLLRLTVQSTIIVLLILRFQFHVPLESKQQLVRVYV